MILVQLWVTGEDPTIEWSYKQDRAWEEAIVPRSWTLLYLNCTKSGRMSRKLVLGKYLSITKSCLTTLTTFKILGIIWAVGRLFYFFNLYVGLHGFAWVWMALRARNASPWLVATLNPQSTCHGPRPGRTLAPWCSCGLPACPGAESTRKTRGRNKKKCLCAKKNTFIHKWYKVPLRGVWREITGVAQADEKGHEGNTAVATAYLCLSKHGERNSRTRVPADYYFLLWTLYF